jgi:hypothetical protein
MTAANLASELESLISRYSIPEIVSALADAMETDVADLMQIEWSDEEIAHAAELQNVLQVWLANAPGKPA